MASVATAIVIGNVGRNVELKETTTGMKIAKFSIATSKKQKDGNYSTSWFDITAFGRNAEFSGSYVTKGRQVYVQGELIQESWEDKATGQKRSKYVINANDVRLMDKKPEAETATTNAGTYAGSTPAGDGFIDDGSSPF